MPLCWVGGFVWNMLRAMTVGGCYLTQDIFAPGPALDLLERERATDVAGWPHVMQSLIEDPTYPGRDLSSVRDGLSASLPPERRIAHPVGSLGMTETGGPHTGPTPAERVTGSPAGYEGSFGHSIPGLEHRIVDPDTGRDLPDGVEGEVVVRGYSLMKGLDKRDPASVFDAHGWYHTGDRGLFRDGWFFFTGRQSDLIKTRGSNVTPAEVESRLMLVPGVKLAVVLGVPHEIEGQQVVALVVAADGAVLPTEAEIRRSLRAKLAPYKVPARIFELTDDEVPSMITSQKLDRAALMELATERLRAAG
jgi:acyl-CoA synthetase (AMP-forming)/AMP-acid ligase II